MISNYADLTQAIYKWMVRDVGDQFFDSTMVDNVIFLAENDLNRRLRVRQMLENTTLSIGAGDNTTAVPSGFLEVYNLYLNEPTYNLLPGDAGTFDRLGLYSRSGVPEYYYIDADNFIWGPLPASNYTATLEFYKKIPNISSLQTTNAVLTDFPDLYLFACLRQAYIAAQDVEREAVYEARVGKIIQEANTNNRRVSSMAKNSKGIAKRII